MTTHRLAKWLLEHEDVECGTAWGRDCTSSMDVAMVSRLDGAVTKVLFGDTAFAVSHPEFGIVNLWEDAK